MSWHGGQHLRFAAGNPWRLPCTCADSLRCGHGSRNTTRSSLCFSAREVLYGDGQLEGRCHRPRLHIRAPAKSSARTLRVVSDQKVWQEWREASGACGNRARRRDASVPRWQATGDSAKLRDCKSGCLHGCQMRRLETSWCKTSLVGGTSQNHASTQVYFKRRTVDDTKPGAGVRGKIIKIKRGKRGAG